MLAMLTAAIEQKKCLKIYYEPGERIIEPHAIGYSAEGNVLVRVYQQSGASASGEHEFWKLLRLDRFNACNDNGSCFDGARVGYKKGDKAMKGGIIREL